MPVVWFRRRGGPGALYFVERENKMSDMSTITTEWITVAEAAKEIGCSGRTVLRLAAAGSIAKFQINPRMFLVKRADVEAKSPRARRSDALEAVQST